MRWDRIDRKSNPWVYTPITHKTEHHGRERRIFIPFRVQSCLNRYDKRSILYLFVSKPRGPHNRYKGPITVSGYRSMIRRACERGGVSPWHPNQLRHTALTLIRSEYGLEAAQVIAGHSEARTTEIYAERDEQLGRRVATESPDWLE